MRVDKIESGNYEGYIWHSNTSKADVINGDFKESLDPTENPFIIEGQLYDRIKKVSYSIKFVDGEYLIHKYEVNDLDFNSKEVEEKAFYANRIEVHKKLLFLQYWREEEDPLCEDMKVLQPKELVFVGLSEKE